MKKAFLREHGKAGFELIEEAFVLLRSSPPQILAAYYVGAVPFVAGFLVFCSDLAGSPSAPERLGGATLAMAALFFWMKFFQARFARLLLDRLKGRDSRLPTAGEALKMASNQAIVHATGLFVLPLAVLAMVPLGWVYAFYQNVTVLDDGTLRVRDLARMARQQAVLWWIQNHLVFGVLSTFGLYVFINWITVGFVGPQVLKMLFGIESVFTRNPQGLLNTTFFASMASLTYLSVDPLFKACYVLRCFYGRSLQSGDDLRTEIRRVSGRVPIAVACLLLFAGAAPLTAQTPKAPAAVQETELDRSISTVLLQDKYVWRTPPDKKNGKKVGFLAGFFKSIGEFFSRIADKAADLARKIVEWLFPKDRATETKGGAAWFTLNLGLLLLVLAAAVGALAFGAVQIIRARRKAVTVESARSTAQPDLTDENTRADELPEDDWTRLGRSLLEQGDLRLALRAFYLASLSHLASRGLITITRSKSNRDYERELRRRAHTIPDLPLLFGENIGIFDRIWYGLHEVNTDLVGHFVRNVERMKAST